jgi:hypothetical protein
MVHIHGAVGFYWYKYLIVTVLANNVNEKVGCVLLFN